MILIPWQNLKIELCYRFEFGNSIKVRVLQFEYLMFGVLFL